jgi:hypothetical protein
MLKTLRTRTHITPTTVIATLALVFAMSGGAYAAGKYLIISTKQISPKVLKSLQGKAGAKGATGAAGATGPAGPAGSAGAGTPGAQGAPGAPGAPGKEGPAGKEGKQGPPGTTGFTKTLPKGATETGAWTLQSRAEGVSATSISFSIPLSGELGSANVFFLEPGESTTACPGSVEDPEAAEGDLCVYASHLAELHPWVAGAISSLVSEGIEGASPSGAMLLLETASSGVQTAFGAWAVTAG